jgi:hypothetical protein
MSCRFLIAYCLFFLVLGCKNNNDPDIIVNIEDDFSINMFEDISNGERRLELRLTSIKEQNCLNYSIDYNLSFNEGANIIELSINDLVEPELCVAGTAQAKVKIPFGSLNTGNYIFYLNLKDAIQNTGRLSVTPEYYNIAMDSDDGVELSNEKLFRIPQQTIWGTIAYNDDNLSEDAESIVAALEDISSIEAIIDDGLYPSGYYGYFELDDQKAINILEAPSTNYHLPFIFSYESGDYAEIADLLESSCDQYPNLNIEFRLANGQIMHCN